MKKKSKRILYLVLIAILVITAASVTFYNSTTIRDSKSINTESDSADLQDKKEVLDTISTTAQAPIVKQEPVAPAPAPVPEPPKALPAAKPSEKTTALSANRGSNAVTNSEAKTPVSKASAAVKVKNAATTTKPTAKPAVYTVRGAARSYSITAVERNLLARLVSAEAEGESYEGKLAVATVVINRVISGTFPGSVTQVIMGKESGYYQFTPVIDGRINNAPSSDAVKAVDRVLGGYRSFPAKVMWFLNPEKSTSFWIIKNKTYFKSIGNHDFYY
jgi:spore germination cell wall hydrolase CwlJ-like protein